MDKNRDQHNDVQTQAQFTESKILEIVKQLTGLNSEKSHLST
jgi:hypothetical protein